MKKVVFLFLFVTMTLSISAQQKNVYAEKVAKGASEHCAEEMSLNASKQEFLYAELYAKITATQKQMKGKDLSQDEKKAIYKKSNKEYVAVLSAEFSKDEIKQITKLTQEYTKSLKKK